MIISGIVISGAGLAQKLGCPTANISLEDKSKIFSPGVYVGWTKWGVNERWPSLICVSESKTDRQQKLEVHLLGWKGFLYGEFLETSCAYKMRDLVPYVDKETMSKKIIEDIQKARLWFGIIG